MRDLSITEAFALVCWCFLPVSLSCLLALAGWCFPTVTTVIELSTVVKVVGTSSSYYSIELSTCAVFKLVGAAFMLSLQLLSCLLVLW